MVPYKTDSFSPGVGVHERELHQATGLRNTQLNAVISTNLAGIFSATIIPAPADGAFPAVGMRGLAANWNAQLPVPMTPTVTLYPVPNPAALPNPVSFRLRVVGRDQFGNSIEEITPWITKTLTVTSLWCIFHLSKVFSVVDDMFVATKDFFVTPALSAIALGWSTNIDPTRGAAAAFAVTNYHGGANPWAILGSTVSNVDMLGTSANWGIGTPQLMQPFGPSMPYASPEILGATATLTRQRTTPTVINNTQRLPARGQRVVAGAAPTTGVCIGRSASGWQGTEHKLGFFSNDNWTTKIAGIDLGGSSLRASGTPTADVQVGEDDLQIAALLRTTIGTRRGANATRIYPNG